MRIRRTAREADIAVDLLLWKHCERKRSNTAQCTRFILFTYDALINQISVATAPQDSAASEIAGMLAAKRKKRKQEEQAAFEGEYVPLDASDWRAKMF